MCLQSPLDWALYRLHTLQTAEVPAGGDQETINTLMLSQQPRPKETHRKTLSQHTGLLQFPWSTKFLHVSAEVTVSTLRSNAGLTALTPTARRHAVLPECAAMLNSSKLHSLCTKISTNVSKWFVFQSSRILLLMVLLKSLTAYLDVR